MGFFGSLLGWDQTMGAINVVLASHLIEKADTSTRKQIAQEVDSTIQRRGVGRRTLEERMDRLSGDSRVVQMNFIVLACLRLGIPPQVAGCVWTEIKNPNPYRIASQITANHIQSALYVTKKQNGIVINWPGEDARINFKSMYERGTI